MSDSGRKAQHRNLAESLRSLQKGLGTQTKRIIPQIIQGIQQITQKDAWFSEKYDPEVLDLLERDRRDNSKKQHKDFIDKFNIGFYDRIDLTVKDPVRSPRT